MTKKLIEFCLIFFLTKIVYWYMYSEANYTSPIEFLTLIFYIEFEDVHENFRVILELLNLLIKFILFNVVLFN